MQGLTSQERDALRRAYPEDPRVARAVAAYERCEELLRRTLYEFGVENRVEIERFLDERPLIPGR